MSECREDLLREALELLREALLNYLASNCRKILSLARLAQQDRLRIELYGLFRYFSPSENFPRFMNALNYVIKCSSVDKLQEVLRFIKLERNEWDERLSKLLYKVEDLEDICKDLT